MHNIYCYFYDQFDHKNKNYYCGSKIYIRLLNYCDNNKIPYKEVCNDSFILEHPSYKY